MAYRDDKYDKETMFQIHTDKKILVCTSKRSILKHIRNFCINRCDKNNNTYFFTKEQ